MQRFFYKKSVLQQLRGFCATYEKKSITRASEIMHLDRSAVSVQIQSLEATLYSSYAVYYDRMENFEMSGKYYLKAISINKKNGNEII